MSLLRHKCIFVETYSGKKTLNKNLPVNLTYIYKSVVILQSQTSQIFHRIVSFYRQLNSVAAFLFDDL